MSYLVLARKYRPQLFADVLGQDAIARTLKNAIEQKRLAHAYLFAGPRGVGKTSMARILARALNCELGESATPCGKCASCREIASGSDLDVREIDAASNRGIDHIRDLRDNVRYAPARGRYKIYIIDEVHQLTSESFNALLKTLEEPPAHVKFIFATTEPEKIPETIRSRCQVFEFRRIGDGEIAKRLREMAECEGFSMEPGTEVEIARKALGGMRDAQSMLDLLITFSGGKVTHEAFRAVTGASSPDQLAEMVDAIVAGDALAVLRHAAAMLSATSAEEVSLQLASYLRALVAVRAGAGPSAQFGESHHERMKAQASQLETDTLLGMGQVLLEARRTMREVDDSSLVLDLALLRLSRWASLMPLSEALAAVRQRLAPAPAGSDRPAAAERAPPYPSAAPASVPRRAEERGMPPVAPANARGAAAPAAPASPAAPVQPPSDVNEGFAALIKAVTSRSGTIAAFLSGFLPISLQGGVLELGDASAGQPRLYDLNDARVKTLLREASEQVFGRAITFKQVPLEGGAPLPPAKKASEVVDRAKQLFEGEIVSD